MSDMAKDVQVIGLGYVGLPLATLLAASGLSVRGVDISPDARRRASEGTALAEEPGFPALLRSVLDDGRLTIAAHSAGAAVHIITVPTPTMPTNGGRRADLSSVDAAAGAVAAVARDGDLVILASTCPVGTTARIARHFGDQAERIKFAYCPERVMPGNSLHEMRQNDRQIGGLTQAAGEAARDLFARFVQGRLSLSDAATAELVKLAENASRDVAIAFANELAGIAEGHGLSPQAVIAEANRHPRVNILSPGIGVGGHCIPVDPWFLLEGRTEPLPLIKAARDVNDARPVAMADRVLAATTPEDRILCLGLSYKADVADFRESPATVIVDRLAAARPGKVVGHDPGQPDAPALTAAARDADVIVLLVPHQSYLTDLPRLDRDVLDLTGRL